MTEQNRLNDGGTFAQLAACASDLLVETESQHQAIVGAEAALARCADVLGSNPSGNKQRLAEIGGVITSLQSAIRAHRLTAIGRRRVVSSLSREGHADQRSAPPAI